MPEEHNLEASSGWQEYRRLVLSELERIDRGVKDLNKKMDEKDGATDKQIGLLWRAIDNLQVRAGMVSGLIGVVVSAGVAIIAAFIGRGH